MKIAELGEFGLINLIQSISDEFRNPEQPSWQRLLIGIGDDTAAWQGDTHIQLATTDTLVQDIHFDLDIVTWEELGWKALAVNLSDIAAMGGVPQYALVSLACPGEIEVENISKLCRSVAALGANFGVAIVGGNLTAAANLVVSITVLGRSINRSILKRSAATPGEQIAVTGHLGLSAAGLEMLKGKISLDTETANTFRKGHLQPVPRVKEGQTLVEQGVKTAIDISDGLVADLDHICQASKVNARVDIAQLPVHPLVEANFPNYLELALCRGEDYELLFTADKAVVNQARRALDCPVTVIGDVVKQSLPNRVTLLDSNGNVVSYNTGGWEHFKESNRAEIP